MSSLNSFIPPSDDDGDTNGGSGGSSGNGTSNNAGGFGFPAGAFPPGLGGGSSSTDDDALAMLIDYNARFINADPTLFREVVLDQVLAVLVGKTKPNALLVGPSGVGKTKIAEEIARRIALGDPLIPKRLKDHTVYELPLYELVAGSGIVGVLESKIKSVVEFATNPKNKVIIYIDEIHQLMTGGDGSSLSKIAEILKPAMARGDMQVIGATTTQEARSLSTDPAFERRLTPVVVDELTPEQTLEILQNVRASFTGHYQHQVMVSDAVLEAVVKIADENSRASSHRPDNALTLLDRTMAARHIDHRRLITDATAAGDTALAQTLENVTQLNLTESRVQDIALRLITGNAKKPAVDTCKLLQKLTSRLRGQDDIFAALVDRIAREELQVFPRTAPIVWMFAGASGVGKSAAARIIAEDVTGQAPITLNMAEFTHESSMTRIIGAPPGYVGSDSNAELPFDSLESNPYRAIVLEEFEKSDRAVQRLMLQAFDEGTMTMARGRVIDFSKTIIIVTTNAARDVLEGRQMGFGSAQTRSMSNASLANELKQFFDAELLGRFSMISGFNPINRELYSDVIQASYEQQRAQAAAAKPRLGQMLPDRLPEDVVRELAEKSYVPSHGARPAGRAVRTWIEDTLLAAQASSAFPIAVIPSVNAAAGADSPDNT